MMLVTLTWRPPNWPAMLPQTFSAATTGIGDPAAPADASAEPTEQAPSRITAAVNSAARSTAGRRRHLMVANPRTGTVPISSAASAVLTPPRTTGVLYI